MEIVKLTAIMDAPIVQMSPLHLDALLTAVHPAMHNQAHCPVRADTTRSGLSPVPLPLLSAYCGSTWVWAATAAEYPDCAALSTSTITRRTDHHDVLYLQRKVTPSVGPMKDRMIKSVVIMTPEVWFYAATNNTKELMRIIQRVNAIGGLRKDGYGSVREWRLEKSAICPHEILAQDGHARRRLPQALCENEAYKRLAIYPPYWMAADAPFGFEVGDAVALREEVKFR